MEDGDKKVSKRKNLRSFIVFILVVIGFAAIIASEQSTSTVVTPPPVTAIASPSVPPPADPSDADNPFDPLMDASPDTSTTAITAPAPGTFQPAPAPTTDDTAIQPDTSPDDATVDQTPQGATALCNDGTYSYDADPATACEGNQGIASTTTDSNQDAASQ